jgi:ABC-2 type transport system permease protein
VSSLTGLGTLVRFTARRDRVRLAPWIVGVTTLFVASAVSVRSLYPTQADVEVYVALFGGNPALVAFAGPGYGFDDPNLGVVLVNETQVFGGIAMALMSMFLVTRQTRAEEESERADLVRANVVGRHAPAAAAVVVVGLTNLVTGAAGAAGFVALGYPAAGSEALAASMTAVGLMFAGTTAVLAQVMSTGRSTLGLASAVLGASFALRAAGDIGDNWVRWLSPMGWANGVRAFADERWWLLGICLVVAVALTVAAFWLSTRRDLGAGIVADRSGAVHAPTWMTHPVGLVVRLQWGAVLGWIVGLFLFGVVFGSIGDDIDELLEDNPMIDDFFAQLEGASLTDSYFATATMMFGVIASGYAVAGTLSARSEESSGRAESLLARPVGRGRWLAGHVGVAAVGSALAVAAAGLGAGIAYAVVASDTGEVLRLLGASLATVPAVLVIVGLSALFVGWSPGAAMAAWGVFAYVAVVAFFGELLRLPAWMRGLSPFHHLPGLPAASDAAWVPLLLLVALAGALAVGGILLLRRRDLAFA